MCKFSISHSPTFSLGFFTRFSSHFQEVPSIKRKSFGLHSTCFSVRQAYCIGQSWFSTVKKRPSVFICLGFFSSPHSSLPEINSCSLEHNLPVTCYIFSIPPTPLLKGQKWIMWVDVAGYLQRWSCGIWWTVCSSQVQ